MARTTVLLTGGTGYIGRRLIPQLVTRGHLVRAIVRPGSESKVPAGAEVVVGDVRSRESVAPHVSRDTVVVHLVGTLHPSPSKAAEFEALDYVAARECIAAAKRGGARQFVYTSLTPDGIAETKQRPELKGIRPLFHRHEEATVPTRTLAHTRVEILHATP
jgi:nucleoside-diphosphate-sugar epimerase